MATIREGKKAALVVVDVQVGVMADAWDATRVVGNVALAVRRAREEGVRVVWAGPCHHPVRSPSASPILAA